LPDRRKKKKRKTTTEGFANIDTVKKAREREKKIPITEEKG